MTEGTGPSGPPRAAVVCVGNELLLGQTVDRNGSWLAGQLSELGFRVVGRWVVGDDTKEIRRTILTAAGTSEVVVVSGGLGPTPDDVTRESVAETLGRPLAVDLGLLEGLRDRFRTRGYGALPERSQRMAEVPEGALVLPNPSGAAPGLVFETEDRRLWILLPGVPLELRRVFEAGVAPFLKNRHSARLEPVAHRVIHTFGVPESILMAEIEKILPESLYPVALAYLPDRLGVRLRLTARGIGETEREARLRDVEELLDPVVSRYRYEADSGDLAEAVGHLLLETGNTLAVAESCTGGLFSKRITDHPGSSDYFLGGVVAYANEIKAEVLGVPEDLIQEKGVVSGAVAGAMAEGVARKLGSSVGVGITGIAGPGGGSDRKPVGTVCYACCIGEETTTRSERFLGERQAVRESAAHATLGLLLQRLQAREE